MNEKKPLFFHIEEQAWATAPNGARSVVLQATPRATMQTWEMAPGVGRGDHHHIAEQLAFVRRGKARVIVEGREFILSEGCFGLVSSDVVHGAFACGNATTTVVDMFLPCESDRVPSQKVRDLGHDWP